MPRTENNYLSLGIEGTDKVIIKGLVSNCTYLVRGGPGTGKTTLGMHFLTSDPDAKGMFVTFGESAGQLKRNAEKIGFPCDRIRFVELMPSMDNRDENHSYTVFSTSEVEEDTLIKGVLDAFETHKPDRIFIDSLTQIRYIAPDSFQFRKQILSLFKYVTDNEATLLATSEIGAEAKDDDLQFLSDGIIQLERKESRRFFSVTKLRGADFKEGPHEMKLGANGIKVYPHLIPSEHRSNFSAETIGSGVPEIDALLHGGLDRGTVNIISGPSGVGKTTLGAQFMNEASKRGENSVIFAFEEDASTLVYRSENIGIPIRQMMENENLTIEQIEPLAFTPDQFAALVRRKVEKDGVSLLMLDSLSGYKQSLKGDDLSHHLHALCRYLKNMGVTVLIINEQETVAGTEFKITDHGISFLGDTIVLLRYLEVRSELRKAIGILKKRTGDFENALREYKITSSGIKVGEPLKGLHGILRGIPELDEPDSALSDNSSGKTGE